MDQPKHRSTPGSKALRKGRLSLPGHVYLLTKHASRRNSGILLGEGIPGAIIESLFWAMEEDHWKLRAFVVMPDHYHALVCLGSRKSLPRLMGSIDNYISLKARKLLPSVGAGCSGPRKAHPGPNPGDLICPSSLWQTTFHDHLVRPNEKIESFVDYIHMNPVEAGLVEHPEDWPFSSAHADYRERMQWD